MRLTVLLLTLSWPCLTAAQAPHMPSPEALAAACMACHGPGGRSVEAIPSIAGEEHAELRRELLAFKSGRKSGTIMGRIASGYSEQEIDAMALYFSEQSGPVQDEEESSGREGED